ncbi:MAG: HAMP domain-containing histidine kinase [Gammaproteobacteria bacterium]|nr:HAMP domain-containing histidine kinase [Gammaproteobacteria bacterium]
MIHNTLTARLVITSVAWVTLTLAIVAVLLTILFQRHIEEYFDAFMFDHMEESIAAARINEQGQLFLTWIPADPRFMNPHSGWYWQIYEEDKLIAGSESLVNDTIDFILPGSEAYTQLQKVTGPGNESLRALVLDVSLKGSNKVYTFAIAGSVNSIRRDVEGFTSKLGITLIILGTGLLIVVLLQIRFGLKPLRFLKDSLTNIRTGKENRLPENFPTEIQPIVHELNALLDHSEGLLERARTQVGDLAHALKNPLTVIRNEASEIKDQRGQLIREKTDAMGAYVERYLSRARAAGSANIIGASVPVQPITKDICYLMARMYQDKNIDIILKDLKGLYFKGDAQDLEEMLGNLLDNACKWANGKVIVSGEQKSSRLVITIDDDGPGIPEDQKGAVLQRGRRLDETVPGSGLGLAIVIDLAQLYHGSLTLHKSDAGGLGTRLELPSAEELG